MGYNYSKNSINIDIFTLKNDFNSLDYYIFELVFDKTDERTSPIIKSN